MKTKYITTIILPMLALCAAGLTACEEESIGLDAGTLQDEESFALIRSAMRSDHSFSGITKVDLFAAEEGEDPETVLIDELFLTLDKPATGDVTAEITIGDTFTEEYLAEVERRNAQVVATWKLHGTYYYKILFEMELLPTANLNLNSETLCIKTGDSNSERLSIKINNTNLDLHTIYLLPLEIRLKDSHGNNSVRKLQYIVSINPYQTIADSDVVPADEEIMAESETDFMSVFYVNTELYQPLLADVMLIRRKAKGSDATFYFAGSVVNIKHAVVDYDSNNGNSVLSLSPDLRYVLENAVKYIRPLQARGKKVCLCIQGGGKGLGFCNMNESQIRHFSEQVKNTIEVYGLDGINLWDEDSGYGKEGMPSINTTSYPKLIKVLRNALPDKLITIVDKDEPTEYFYDIAACGGIEVGKYIDYAWHGYSEEHEPIQIIEPWEANQQFSKYIRKPIAGLTPEKYGSVNIPRYKTNPSGEANPMEYYKNVEDSYNILAGWKSTGHKNNNIIVFGFDLRANEQTAYEGYLGSTWSFYTYFHDEGRAGVQLDNGSWTTKKGKYTFSHESTCKYNYITYGMFRKDW